MSTSDGVSHGASRDLPRLTSVRTFAALWVFGFHAYSYAPSRAATPFRTGYVGVGLFFVLSGFILTWVSVGPVAPGRFYFRRFVRIYPAYLVALVVAAILAGLPSLPSLAATVGLLQAWFTTGHLVFGLNPPSWSLSCEAAFYAVFPFVLPALRRLSGRRLLLVHATWFGIATAVVVGLAAHGGLGAKLAYTNPLLRSCEFGVGILAALLVQRGHRLLPLRAASGLLAALVIVTAIWLPIYPTVDVLLAVPFALFIAALAWKDLDGARGPLHWPAMILAGQVSFCFYLVHQEILRAFARHVAPSLATVLGLLTAAIVAWTLHVGVERPAQRWFTQRWPMRPKPARVD
ncbi:MAG: hypothetical protein JWL79_2361 [Frankiales bacterium]|nr:hypothetical protein [Frankiales bacterium]